MNIGCFVESPASKLTVCRRKGFDPPFITANMSKMDIWIMCSTIRKSYQQRVKREKKLRTMTTNLSLVLRDVPKCFRNVLTEALNAKDDGIAQDKINNLKAYTASALHLIVVYCFQDFFSSGAARDKFMAALKSVIFRATGTNQKLNALRILSVWIKNFRGRDFPYQRIIKFLEKHYKPILEQFKIDEDFKTLPNFQLIREDLPSMEEIMLGGKWSKKMTKTIGMPPKSQEYVVKADFIYIRCLEKFNNLCAGDFANCQHKVRKSRASIKAMTTFLTKTSLVVAIDILQKENASLRGERIDEWIRAAR